MNAHMILVHMTPATLEMVAMIGALMTGRSFLSVASYYLDYHRV
jgi:hypothetical protein